MLIATHKHIANSAYEMLEEHVKNLVDKSAFIEGAYYPDIKIKYAIIPHIYEKTIHIVKNKMDFLLSSEQDKIKLSHELGIIAHFVADYCSPYHTNKQYMRKNILSHIIYEHRTHINLSLIFLNQNELKNTIFKSTNNLPKDLGKFIDAYMQGHKNIENEIKFALINTVHIVNLIMAEYIKVHIHKDNYIDLNQLQGIPSAAYYPDEDIASAVLF